MTDLKSLLKNAIFLKGKELCQQYENIRCEYIIQYAFLPLTSNNFFVVTGAVKYNIELRVGRR